MILITKNVQNILYTGAQPEIFQDGKFREIKALR